MISALSDPDADEARDLLQRELSKPEYNAPENWIQRIVDWVFEQLNNLLNVVPGSGWLSGLLVVLVLAIVMVAIVFATRYRLRARGLRGAPAAAVLDDATRTAADYRTRARRAAEASDWDSCLLDSYRALTASAGERTLLDNAPTRTAHEVADRLAIPFVERADDLRWAADAFDRVRYGEISCEKAEAERVRDLERSIQRATPAAAWSSA